jgi:hypothetical protein
MYLMRSARHGATGPIRGYLADAAVLQSEYRQFYGRLMRDPQTEQLFQQAAARTRDRDYAGAVRLLEDASRTAALPVIFNDLGVLLAEMGDRERASTAFREVLIRDGAYAPARENIARLHAVVGEVPEPVNREVEPNDSTINANLIAPNVDVQAEIAEGTGDVDCFRFVSPAAPRDVLRIGIAPAEPSLEIGLRIYDGGLRLTDMGQDFGVPGQPAVRYFSPPPNSAWYLEIWGARHTAGEYSVRVQAMRAFDAYEPNDDIFSAARIEVGRPIDANIMDDRDTDFYVFQSPRSGVLSIDLQNRSSTLVPALTTFNSEQRTTGFGPDVHAPGSSLHHTLKVEANQTYYLQVWPQSNTSGAYSLTVQ